MVITEIFMVCQNHLVSHVTDMIFFVACSAELLKILALSQQLWEVTKTKILAGLSCATVTAKLIEIVQYINALACPTYT